MIHFSLQIRQMTSSSLGPVIHWAQLMMILGGILKAPSNARALILHSLSYIKVWKLVNSFAN